MGSGNINERLRSFLTVNYADYKADLFAAFTVRIIQTTFRGGFIGMMTPFNWMFLSSFEKLREKILRESTITNLVRPEFHAFFDSAYVTICGFTLYTRHLSNYKGAFIDLDDFYGVDIQPLKTLEAIQNPSCGWFHRASAADFEKIPGSPIAYWASKSVLRAFEAGISLGNAFEAKSGVMTGDDEHFLQGWYEVDFKKIGFGYEEESDIDPRHIWLPMNKEEGYRKWSGRYVTVLRYVDHGRNFDSVEGLNFRLRDKNLYFKPGISWGDVTAASSSFRYHESGLVFAARAPTIFSTDQQLAAFLNSSVANYFRGLINPTLSFNLTDLYRLPLCELTEDETLTTVKRLVGRLIVISNDDWNDQETSWGFKAFPLLGPIKLKMPLQTRINAYAKIGLQCSRNSKRLEEENNRIFIDAYGLQDELTPDVPLGEITLTCNPWYRYGGQGTVNGGQWAVISEQWPEVAAQLAQISEDMAPDEPEARRLGLEQRLLADTVRELASYAVGCMFGRYSLDKPGLLLANQGERVEDYVRKVVGGRVQAAEEEIRFMPDRDNAIPILDGDWFEDDIVGRFRQFLRVAFGEEHFADNLAFVEAALGRDLRSFFLREFYDDHLKRYKKRPIYWLFSSAKGSFNVLIYMHRYRPDTVSVVLNGYLRELPGQAARPPRSPGAPEHQPSRHAARQGQRAQGDRPAGQDAGRAGPVRGRGALPPGRAAAGDRSGRRRQGQLRQVRRGVEAGQGTERVVLC